MALDGAVGATVVDTDVSDKQRWAARRVAVAMAIVAVVAIAFGRSPGHVNSGVLASLMGAVVVTELLSAALLFNRFVGSRALWLGAVGAGYFFIGCCVIAYLLTFPGVFSRAGYFGANEQTALTIWCVWHAVFPLAILVALILRAKTVRAPAAREALRVVGSCIALSVILAALLAYLIIRNSSVLPELMNERGFTLLMVGGVLPFICGLDVIALIALARQRSQKAIEVWLPIAVLASMLDAIMGVIASRYSIVWYVGKFFAVTSSSIMMTVFLTEIAQISKALARANRELRAVAEHISRHDALTDLPNRSLLEKCLRETLLSDAERGSRTALLHVNLDHFRTINEAIGMAAGDEFLREVARRLCASARREHVVACLGGDDFVVLFSQIAGIEEVAEFARALSGTLRQSFLASGQRIFPSASIGIAVTPEDGIDAEALLGAATAAMNIAKQSGGNQTSFYQSCMRSTAVERIRLESELRTALRHRQLLVYYQPIVDLMTRRTVGAEALIRWQHPRRGLLTPDAFIASAEQNGLIVQVGSWVLETVTRQMGAWDERGMHVPVAVNVSVREFRDPGFFEHLCETIRGSGISPEMLTIEVTETLAIDEAEQTRQTLAACRELGVRISLDDFGTNHACLANIKRLPITTLKIDKTFIRDVAKSPTDAAIVTAILSFAKSLDFVTVAEGVEAVDQLQWLRSAGCAYAQGYLFARPIPAREFEERFVEEARNGQLTRSA